MKQELKDKKHKLRETLTPLQLQIAKYIMSATHCHTETRYVCLGEALDMLKQSTPVIPDDVLSIVEESYKVHEKEYLWAVNRSNNLEITEAVCEGLKPRDIAVRNVLRGIISLRGCCLSETAKTNLKVAMNVYWLLDVQNVFQFEIAGVYKDVTHTEMKPCTATTIKKYVGIIRSLAKTDKIKIHSYIVYSKGLNIMPDNPYKGDEEEDFLALQALVKQDKEDKARQKEIKLQIKEQKAEVDKYLKEKQPYKRVRERRYDFKVTNQPKTNEQFVEELRAIYGDTYDYTPVHYVNSKTIVECFCNKHQQPFRRMPQHLLKGYGCPLCNKEQGKTFENTCRANVNKNPINKKWTKARFVRESRKKFGNDTFDYSKVKYVNNDTRVTLIRKSDGKIITVTPCEHLRHDADWDGIRHYNHKKTNEQRLQSLKVTVRDYIGDKYLVPNQEVDDSHIKLLCPEHGPFVISRATIYGGNCMCPDCAGRCGSVGERNVRNYLDAHGVEYIWQYNIIDHDYFPNNARPDFFLPDSNTFIEFQGELHYMDIKICTNQQRSLQDQMERDYNMRRYCADKGIRLIEIPYQFRDDVGTFLDRVL